jgi:PKD repeat protein
LHLRKIYQGILSFSQTHVMKKLSILILVLNLFLGTAIVKSQTDTEFWFAVPKVTEGHGWPERKFFFRFANLTLENEITISIPAYPEFVPITIKLLPLEEGTLDVTDLIVELWNENPNQIYNRGIRITSRNLTSVNFEVGTTLNSDIYSLKGRNALGKEFYVPFQNKYSNGNYYPKPYSGIYIVATEDNTKITILPAKPVFPGRPAGVPFDIILNRGQTVAIVPDDYSGTGRLAANHLGGTRITSTNPVAITTSDDSVEAGSCRDLVGDQIVPVSIIGTEYIAIKSHLTIPEYFYITATRPDTQVFIDGEEKSMLQPGEQFSHQFTQQNHHIKTSNPVYVFHTGGFGCEIGGSVLPPINSCTGNSKVSFSRSVGENFFLNILVRAGAEDGFVLNGDNTLINAYSFQSVPGTTDWLVATFQMTQAQIPVGVLSHIENSKNVFHLAMINGGPTTGTMYGYLSDFNQLNIKANVSGAGSYHSACYGEPIQLVAQGGIIYQWHPTDFLDDPTSATPIAMPDTTIKYTVTVSGLCNVVDSVSVKVRIFGPAKAAFSLEESSGCSPFEAKIFNESHGISHYSWRMGDGYVYATDEEEFTHTYTNHTSDPIVRQLMLRGMFGLCRDTMMTDITIYPELHALADADIKEGYAPLEVEFVNQSVGAQNYLWDFGDGSSSHQKDPSHIFHNLTDMTITYTVTLIAMSDYGCISYDTTYIEVKPTPMVQFSFDPDTICSTGVVNFHNTSLGATQYNWSFDGGNSFEIIHDEKFERIFTNNTGSFQTREVWLIGENEYEGKDTLIRALTINPAVEADFSSDVTEGCSPLSVQFQNTSIGADINTWSFDGAENFEEINETHFAHVFVNNSNEPKYREVWLIGKNNFGCADTLIKTIHVFPEVKAAFAASIREGCTPLEVEFVNQSVGAQNYSWDFGNGSTSTLETKPVITFVNNDFEEVKIFQVSLEAISPYSCSDIAQDSILIYTNIKADFSYEHLTHQNVLFHNKSNGGRHYSWDFGDGTMKINQASEITHLFQNNTTEEIIYNVQLVAANDYGCHDTIIYEVLIAPADSLVPEIYIVEFNMDMSNVSDFDGKNHNLYITGSMIGWITPGIDPDNQRLSKKTNSEIWTIIMPLEPGMYEYNYFREKGNQSGQWDSDVNRIINVSGDTIFNDVWNLPSTSSFHEKENKLIISPNPAQNILYIESSAIIKGFILYNMDGKKIFQVRESNSYSLKVNLENYESGLYIINLLSDEGVIARKITIMR